LVLDIFICCDLTQKGMKERVRRINSVFVKEPDVSIVEPGQALAFLRRSTLEIDSMIKVQVSTGDIVLRLALKSVEDLSLRQRAVLLYILWNGFYHHSTTGVEDLCRSAFVSRAYEQALDVAMNALVDGDEDSIEDLTDDSDEFSARLATDLESLEAVSLQRTDDERYQVRFSEADALMAVMLDGAVRYDYEGDQMLDYMLSLIGLSGA